MFFVVIGYIILEVKFLLGLLIEEIEKRFDVVLRIVWFVVCWWYFIVVF